MKRYPDINALNRLYDRAANKFRGHIFITAHLNVPLDKDVLLQAQQAYEGTMRKCVEELNPSKLIIELRSCTNTASVPVSATAYAARHEAANFVLTLQRDSQELDSQIKSDASKIINRVRQAGKKKRAVQPVHMGGESEVIVSANYAAGDEASVFGENLPRLRKIKRKDDPDCIFSEWYPIKPADVLPDGQ